MAWLSWGAESSLVAIIIISLPISLENSIGGISFFVAFGHTQVLLRFEVLP
jgi:hypothetical protein